jgi:hypothetical protein
MSEGTPVHVEQTERAFRQATEGTMGNDILLGLIELVTNCDDQYGDERGSILIRLPKPDPDGTWRVEVYDKATGLAFEEIGAKLLKFGGRTSGHERGETRRGNRGRGARDICHFGRVRWDMFKDGRYCWLWLDRNGKGEQSRKAERAESYRDIFGIPKNGVVATITCDRQRFRRPQRERIKHRLEYAVQLRAIMANPKRTIKLQYGDDDAVNLRYVEPNGRKEFPAVDVEIAGYPGYARVSVAEVSTPFEEDQNDPTRQGGLLIVSGRAVHESTLYRFESSPYSGYFLGQVRWDTIDDLSRQFDDRDDGGAEADPTNPAQIIKADRRGLNAQHPAAKALKAAVEEVLRPHFERKAKELGEGGKETRQTKQRLEGLARVIAKFHARKAEELDFELAQHLSHGVELTPEVPILEVIPPRRLLEFGTSHTFSVRVRSDALLGRPSEAEVLLFLATDPEGCLALSGAQCSLMVDKRLEGRMSGTFTATASSTEGKGIIEITLPGFPSVAVDIDVIEPLEPQPPEAPLTFQFERASYRVPLGRSKKILLLAPAPAVERHGTRVTVTSSNAQGVLVRQPHADLAPSLDGDWYQTVIEVEGRQHGAAATVTAQCGSGPLRADASVSVRRDTAGPTPPEIKFAAMQSPVRGTFDTNEATGLVTITVNATHSAVRRYFGPPPDFRGQESLQARLMVAEIVADLTVLDVLRRYLRQQPVPVEQLYRRRFIMLSDLLPLCHASQLTEAELLSQTRPSGRRKDRAPATAQTVDDQEVD